MWYNGEKLIKKDALFNFVIGGRGIGKSFYWKKYALERFIENGEQFVYLRRYKEEVKGGKMMRLFNDVQAAGYMTDHDIKTNGNQIICDKQIAGYVLTLSTANIAKSDSFPNVSLIIYDEFLIETGTYHYLRNEPELLLGLYETVARNRDNVKMVCLSNAITILNPYFTYFNLRMPGANERFWRSGEKLVEAPYDGEFVDMRKSTRFASLINGTEYGDYSINNQMLLDSNTMISKKSAKSKCICNIAFSAAILGVWVDTSTGICYISADRSDTERTYTCESATHDINTILIGSYKPYEIKLLIEQYRNGAVRFETTKIKAIMRCFLQKVR